MDNIDYDYVESTKKAVEEVASSSGGSSLSLGIWAYVAIGIVVAIILASFIMTIVLLVKVNAINRNMNSAINASNVHSQVGNFTNGVGCVFCPNCGNQYDAAEKMCPYCKTKKPV